MQQPLLAGVCVLAALGVRIHFLDPAYADRSRRQEVSIAALDSPGPKVLRLTSLEHNLAVADLLWLDVVQTVGAYTVENERWPHILRRSEVATDLDQKYFGVYHSTGILLSVHAKLVDASDRILSKGEAALPERWEFAMLLGYNAYFVRGAPASAAEHMARGAKLPGAPRFLGALAGRMRAHTGDIDDGVAFLEALVPTLDGLMREDAEQRLALLKSEPILREYDDACVLYRAVTGLRNPSPRHLFAMFWTRHAPYDLLGSEIELDSGCIARTPLIPFREHEARERVGMARRAAQ